MIPFAVTVCLEERDVMCLVGQISMHGLLQEHLSLSILSFQNFYGDICLYLPWAIICKVSDMSGKLCLLPLPRIC